MSNRRKQKEEKRKRAKKQRQSARRAEPKTIPADSCFDLKVPEPGLTFPPIYLDSRGTRLPDPFETLGLEPEEPHSPEQIRTAFLKAIAKADPEADPQRARELVEARDYLLEPRNTLDRIVGDLRVPNPENFVPGYTNGASLDLPQDSTPTTDWDSRTRLVAMMTLYSMLEMEIDSTEPRPKNTGTLFD